MQQREVGFIISVARLREHARPRATVHCLTEQAQVGTAQLLLILLTTSYRNQSTSLKNPLTVCTSPLLSLEVLPATF